MQEKMEFVIFNTDSSIQFNVYCHKTNKFVTKKYKTQNKISKRGKILKHSNESPVLSSNDCLIKDPIFSTCFGDDGQSKYLIFSLSEKVLKLIASSSEIILLKKSDRKVAFFLQCNKKCSSSSRVLHEGHSLFSLGIFKCLPFSINKL